MPYLFLFFFFFNDTATTEIYTLSLHDALPIFVTRSRTLPELVSSREELERTSVELVHGIFPLEKKVRLLGDRKSTRLNSSHSQISYAVFCLKKKKKTI